MHAFKACKVGKGAERKAQTAEDRQQWAQVPGPIIPDGCTEQQQRGGTPCRHSSRGVAWVLFPADTASEPDALGLLPSASPPTPVGFTRRFLHS